MSKNQKLIQVILYDKYILLRGNMKHETGRPDLRIDRITNKIVEVFSENTMDKPQANYYTSMFLGIFQGYETSYLVFCEESTQLVQIMSMRIFKIDSISFAPIHNHNDSRQKDVLTALQDLQSFIQTGGMYFSIGGDLSLSNQKLLQNKPPNEKFIWNNFLLKQLKDSNISPFWTKEIISGFVGGFNTVVQYQKVVVVLISRRGHNQGGISSRGIDDEGNVSNYVETEQILLVKDKLFSYVSIRGSVPIFWNQEGVKKDVKLVRSFDLTITAFNKHFKHIQENYGQILSLNLMSISIKDEQVIKSLQKLLTESFRKHIDQFGLKYDSFDYSQMCKKQDKLNLQIMNYSSIIDLYQFFAYNQTLKCVVNTQMGAFRINCLDCLNKTDAFMTKIFFLVIEKQFALVEINLSLINSSKSDLLSIFDDTNKKTQHDFMICFKNIWLDNAEQLSQIYTGTGSINSDVNPKSGIFGFLDNSMKSINRLYNQNFEDEYKQNAMNLLLHGMESQVMQETEVEVFMRSKSEQFSVQATIDILVVSWNVNGKIPQKNIVKTLFNLEDRKIPTVIVVGLQEIVTLNPQNVMIISNESVIKMWDILLDKSLSELGDFVKIAGTDLVGIYTTVYVQKSQIHRLQQIEFDIVKTGLGGALGNKGAAGVKFNIDETQFMFINCHLSSGAKQSDTRLLEVKDIHDRLLSKKVKIVNLKQVKQRELDYRFFFGDMNFRIDGQYAPVVAQCENYKFFQQKNQVNESNKVMADLLDLDQLSKLRSTHETLKFYQEGQINFLPTYKYDTGTDVYDTSKKMRTPSWCDRILYQSLQEGGSVQQHFYSRQECSESDHKPVSSCFTVRVNKIDVKKRDQIKMGFGKPIQEDTELVDLM